jgi:hypothetical protein
MDKSKPAVTPPTPRDAEPEAKNALTPTERRALKKAKQKEKRTKGNDIEKALAELAIQCVASTHSVHCCSLRHIRLPSQPQLSQTTSKGHSLADLLGASLQHLDAEAELRKFFGSRVIQAAKTQPPSASRRNAGALRSNLTRPRPTWWSASQREGLSIRPLSQDEVRAKLHKHGWEKMDEKWWTVEYSKKYKSMTRAFMQTVLSGGELKYILHCVIANALL